MRIVTSAAAGRPQYFDRNPVNRTQYNNASGAAPHAPTTRWTYTVPAGKKAFVDSLMTVVRRELVAAPAAIAEAYVTHTPSGGSAAIVAYSGVNSNTVGAQDKVNVAAVGAMLPGDAIAGLDTDLSTGGSATEIVSAKILEYDA